MSGTKKKNKRIPFDLEAALYYGYWGLCIGSISTYFVMACLMLR